MPDSLLASTTPNTEGQTATADGGATATTEPTKQQTAADSTAGKGASQQTQQAAEGKGQDQGDKGKPQGAPDKYEFKATEGEAFDAEVIKAYSEVAKELNLTQDAAQKVLDKVAPVISRQQQAGIEAVRKGWRESTAADKEFGGDRLEANLAIAKKAIDKFGTPELRALLDNTDLGSHPEVVRLMYRVGKAISEDSKVVAGGSGGARGAQDHEQWAKDYYRKAGAGSA